MSFDVARCEQAASFHVWNALLLQQVLFLREARGAAHEPSKQSEPRWPAKAWSAQTGPGCPSRRPWARVLLSRRTPECEPRSTCSWPILQRRQLPHGRPRLPAKLVLIAHRAWGSLLGGTLSCKKTPPHPTSRSGGGTLKVYGFSEIRIPQVDSR
jgi:hypothetical protein